jgi:LmbE family N-acetylglucosaminyl deacetylase
VIEEVRPDTVVTFGPDGNTGHPDHRTVSAWATAAFDRAAAPGARLLHTVVTERWARRWKAVNERLGVFADGYPVVDLDGPLAVDLVLDADQLTRKVRALRAQATQTDGPVAALGENTYAAWVADEAFVEAR